MIPIALFAGLAAGFTKIRWWIVPLAAVAWTLLLVFQSEASGLSLLGGFVLAAANAAVGARQHPGAPVTSGTATSRAQRALGVTALG